MKKRDPKESSEARPGRLKLKGDWTKLVKKAMGKGRPAEGWPSETKPKKRG